VDVSLDRAAARDHDDQRTAGAKPAPERRGMVRRSRLLALLDAVAGQVPLIVLAAPAGYGKTTVLRQWVAAGDRPLAWVSLDPADDDPARLAGHLALALQAGMPMPAATAERLGRIPATEPATAPARLLRALRELREPAVLVLDDVQEVLSPGSVALIRSVIEAGDPRRVQVAVASRSRHALALAGLLTAGRYAEFGREELLFSEAESRQLFATGPRFGPGTVKAVLRRTEGWVAGIYLAALAGRQDSRDHPAEGSAATIAGDDVYIADYFRDELLAAEPPESVRFLLRTSILEQMSGPLCDALLDRSGSAVRLADAERRNLFVVPLDRDGEWYRYHRLFREMLLSELRRREPGEEFRLHRRAAAWYERQGRPEPAVIHALAGRDELTAARLINGLARDLPSGKGLARVRSWLRSLDDDTLVAYPPVAVTAGWIWALTGDPVRAQSCLLLAEEAAIAGPLPDGSSSLESAVATLTALSCPLGVDRMVEDARAAVRLERPGSPWRSTALAALGVAHVLTGQPEPAVKELTAAAGPGRDGQRLAAALARAELALLALEAGERGAEAHAQASLDLVESGELRESILAMLTYAVCAWVAARRSDVEAARRLAGAAQRLGADPSPAAFPWLGAQVAVVLGRVSLELGDPVAARMRVDEARQYLSRLLTDGILRARVQDLAERLSRHDGRVLASTAMSLTAAEVRVLQLLPTHLSLGEIAEELHVSRNTVKTQVAATYRKLGAGTRTAAVERGRELGLLPT
jgi:LuxR family maltose regulon positive regulatory protein